MEGGLYAKSITIKQSIALQRKGKNTTNKITIATSLSYRSFCLSCSGNCNYHPFPRNS